jgi:isopenicillin-N N-acyltransferase-like protein
MPPLRILELAGSAYAMGEAHGGAYRDDIRRYTAERITLAGSAAWTGHALSRDAVLALAEACLPEHERYAPELVEELRGIAAATELSLAELIITNGFTDFIDLVYARQQSQGATDASADNCTAFIIPDGRSADGHGYFGQTWDMNVSSIPYVVMLRGRPTGHPAFLAFSITGCVGMIGMNDAGIAVGINNLLGGDGQIGVTWPFVIRRILQQRTLDAALACITEAQLAGAHNYLLYDATGKGYNVEAMSSHCEITPLAADALVHANHCLDPACKALDRPRAPESQASSEARQTRASVALDTHNITAENLMALTRDDTLCVLPKPPLQMATCGAAIMQPATGKLWALCGLPTENDYTALSI